MNRASKEEGRRRAEPRRTLTPEEIADLERGDAEEAVLLRCAGQLHARLFPEEYDQQYDDLQDARLRAQGGNPMSSDYIARTDARRQELGFAPLMGKKGDLSRDTGAWVQRMLRDGREDELSALAERVEAEEHAARPVSPDLMAVPATELSAEIDAWLARPRERHGDSRSDAEEEAIRIYGFFLGRNATGFRDRMLQELHRRHPEVGDEELRRRIEFAKNWWLEAYGY